MALLPWLGLITELFTGVVEVAVLHTIKSTQAQNLGYKASGTVAHVNHTAV
jgi:hypothetical protein